MMMPANGFSYVKGIPASFKRTDLEDPVTREFCAKCGTHIAWKRAGPIVLKVGTLDDPDAFGSPQIAVYTCDKQSFLNIPEGTTKFERMPPR
jgi:hypothetical protein